MEKFVVITYLFDVYQEVLTDKQRELLRDYYFEDLSLGELAQQHQISRQSIFDTIKKAEQKLLDYENKLHLFDKYQYEQQTLTKIKHLCEQMQEGLSHESVEYMQEVMTLVDKLINKI